MPAASSIAMEKVKSSNLVAIGYDQPSRILRILFQEDRYYDYENVPAALYLSLMAATSKGSFFQKYIKNNFKYRRVTGQVEVNATLGFDEARQQFYLADVNGKVK